MRTVRVVTLALFALPFASPLAARVAIAHPQSAFTTSAAQAGEMRFRDMDRNNDGVITRREWRGSDRSFRTHDWNGDGILSGDELRPASRQGTRTLDERVLDASSDNDRMARFRALDANGDGRIEELEWQESLDAFDWLDRNGDRVLTRDEVMGATAGDRSGANTTAGRQPCNASAAAVVDDIYQQLLERSAEEGSAAFTQQLAAGRVTVRDIVAEVAKSDEHVTRHFWQPVVSAVYQQVSDREPNPSDLREMASGLAARRIEPPEIAARAAASGLGNDEEGVRTLYRRLLGRDADPQGLQGYVDLARRQGIDAVARDIVRSAEYVGRAANPYESAVRSLYRHLLGRDPDPQGLRDLTRLAAQGSADALIDRILASAEYEQRYGSDTVPGRGVRYCGPSARRR